MSESSGCRNWDSTQDPSNNNIQGECILSAFSETCPCSSSSIEPGGIRDKRGNIKFKFYGGHENGPPKCSDKGSKKCSPKEKKVKLKKSLTKTEEEYEDSEDAEEEGDVQALGPSTKDAPPLTALPPGRVSHYFKHFSRQKIAEENDFPPPEPVVQDIKVTQPKRNFFELVPYHRTDFQDPNIRRLKKQMKLEQEEIKKKLAEKERLEAEAEEHHEHQEHSRRASNSDSKKSSMGNSSNKGSVFGGGVFSRQTHFDK